MPNRKKNQGVKDLVEPSRRKSLFQESLNKLNKAIEKLPQDKTQKISTAAENLIRELGNGNYETAISNFETYCQTLLIGNGSSIKKAAKAVASFAATALVTVFAAMLGFAMGFVFGLCTTGPGAIISAFYGAGTAAIIGARSTYGLFKPPAELAAVSEFARTVHKVMEPIDLGDEDKQNNPETNGQSFP